MLLEGPTGRPVPQDVLNCPIIYLFTRTCATSPLHMWQHFFFVLVMIPYSKIGEATFLHVFSRSIKRWWLSKLRGTPPPTRSERCTPAVSEQLPSPSNNFTCCFTPFPKFLSIFPSLWLFAIRLPPIFSLGWYFRIHALVSFTHHHWGNPPRFEVKPWVTGATGARKDSDPLASCQRCGVDKRRPNLGKLKKLYGVR